MKNILKNQKGAFSILAVAVVFILVLGMAAFVDLTTKTYVLNEIQGNMDMAGVTALQSSIDLKSVRAEVFAIDPNNKVDGETGVVTKGQFKNIVADKYRAEISKYVKGNNNYIRSFTEKRINVYLDYTDKGLGTSTKKRPQLVVDATYNAEVKVGSQFDLIGNLKNNYKDGFGTATADFSITQNGTTKDGYTNLIIRSVSREVFR